MMSDGERLSAFEVIQKLALVPLPGEGGFFRETHRSLLSIPGEALPSRYQGSARQSSTAIYYLLTDETFSALHRLKSDEVYFFHAGDPLLLSLVDDSGKLSQFILSNRLINDEQCQGVVPSGVWQGSRLIDGGKWALLGTTVAPGFEFSDWEIASPTTMANWPVETRQSIESLLAPAE